MNEATAQRLVKLCNHHLGLDDRLYDDGYEPDNEGMRAEVRHLSTILFFELLENSDEEGAREVQLLLGRAVIEDEVRALVAEEEAGALALAQRQVGIAVLPAVAATFSLRPDVDHVPVDLDHEIPSGSEHEARPLGSASKVVGGIA